MKQSILVIYCIVVLSAVAKEPVYPFPKRTTPIGGFVRDSETARQIAEIILTTKYGKDVMESYRPYKAKYVEQWNAWEVYGRGRPVIDGKIAVLGGEPHVAIRKVDGAILSCWMTK
jgi:NTF2 fold immunity protein